MLCVCPCGNELSNVFICDISLLLSLLTRLHKIIEDRDIWQLVMSVLTAVAIAFVRLDYYHRDRQNVDHR